LFLWLASLGAGLCLAYTAMCHWFGFLSASKNTRLEMFLVFGAIFIFLSWRFLKWGFGFLFENLSLRRFYIFLAAAVVIAGGVVLFVLPAFVNALISSQAQPAGTLTTTLKLLSTALTLSDFVSLAGLLFFAALFLSTVVSRWKLVSRAGPRLLAVFFPLGILLLVCVAANVVLGTMDKGGTYPPLAPVSSNSLLSLDASLPNIRVYTVFFENYAGWTLVAPANLVSKLKINASGELKTYGRIGSIINADYPADLTDQEMQDLLALKNIDVDNGSGLHYIAILKGDPNRKICLRKYGNDVFVVPVSLSPICGSK
jgi:hypothetical protein